MWRYWRIHTKCAQSTAVKAATQATMQRIPSRTPPFLPLRRCSTTYPTDKKKSTVKGNQVQRALPVTEQRKQRTMIARQDQGTKMSSQMFGALDPTSKLPLLRMECHPRPWVAFSDEGRRPAAP
mmetsp:Transcript_34797/g.92924  ORF Transcript_34797/g.92924 Transcript_34797/m.92924 type:complete len:124 (+) Transcript_34797:654-1025(+)